VAVPADDRAQVNAGARQWLVQLAAAHRRLQATCSEALAEVQRALAAETARATEVAETLKDLRTAQEQLGQQLVALEVFQARFDSTLKSMEERVTVTGVNGRTDRGLRAAVAALATISAASLALGLWSILTG
jgi:septal ring factor EnvC (AmiA/AmiB activator)